VIGTCLGSSAGVSGLYFYSGLLENGGLLGVCQAVAGLFVYIAHE